MSLFGEIAAGVGSLVGAGASYLGSKAQADAANRTADQSYAIYSQQRKDAAPYRKVGNQALNQLRDIYLTGDQDFKASPGYDFRLREGTKALERGAAARGNQFSGSQAKALTQYGQDLGTAEYDSGMNRLLALAGFGPTAVNQGNQAGNQLSINLGNANAAAGAARASGYEGVGSSINSGINNFLTLAQMKGYL